MIFYILTISTITFIVINFYVLLYQRFSKKFRYLNNIPGPQLLPIVGDFFYFTGARETIFKNERARAKKYSPIYRHFIFHWTGVYIFLPEDLEIVLSGMKHTKKSKVYELLHAWLGTGLLTSDGTKWQYRRKLLTPSFHFSILQGFLDIFNRESQCLVERLENYSNQSINVIPIINEFTLQTISETSMGIKLDFQSPRNLDYKKALMEYVGTILDRLNCIWWYNNHLYRWLKGGFYYKNILNRLHSFSMDIIKERQRNIEGNSYVERKRLAMLDLLLKAKLNNSSIDDEGIREEVDTFMFEGHDTTAVAISFILMVLANEQKFQNEIYEEIISVIGDIETPTYQQLSELPFTERCLKECLRLYPSVPYIGRMSDEDIQTTSGYIIPKDTLINVNIYDIHRNPELYPDPERFDPDRFLPENIKKRHPFAYIPFSAGPRNCIGQKFAMLELKTVLCAILRRFQLFPIDNHNDLVFGVDLVLRTSTPIRVKFVPRIKK